MGKTLTSLKLSDEVLEDIKRRREEDGFEFQAWVEETYIKEMMSETGIKNQIIEHQKSAKILQNRLTHLKRDRQNRLLHLKREQQIELKNAREAIKRNPEWIDGRLKLWNNMFRDSQLTKPEFMALLEKKEDGGGAV